MFLAQFIRYAQKPARFSGTKYQLPGTLEVDEIAVWFDLGRPIAAQLKLAKKLLKQNQTANVPFRVRSEHYRKYLRLLDAKSSR
jgi:hypothetical protein